MLSLVTVIANASVISTAPIADIAFMFIGGAGSFIFAMACTYLLGYELGRESVFKSLSREVELKSVPVKGNVVFIAEIIIPFKNGKKGEINLVSETTRKR